MRAREDLYSDAGRVYSETDPAKPDPAGLPAWATPGGSGVYYTKP